MLLARFHTLEDTLSLKMGFVGAFLLFSAGAACTTVVPPASPKPTLVQQLAAEEAAKEEKAVQIKEHRRQEFWSRVASADRLLVRSGDASFCDVLEEYTTVDADALESLTDAIEIASSYEGHCDEASNARLFFYQGSELVLKAEFIIPGTIRSSSLYTDFVLTTTGARQVSDWFRRQLIPLECESSPPF